MLPNGPQANALLQRILRTEIYKRGAIYRVLRRRLEQGQITEAQAQIYHAKFRKSFEAHERSGNRLEQAPENHAEMYGDQGAPDIRIGQATESSEVQPGLHVLKAQPKHVLIAGQTGSGKSSLLRSILRQLAALNQFLNFPFVILVLCFKKDHVQLPEEFGTDRWRLLKPGVNFFFGTNPPAGMIPFRQWSLLLSSILAARCSFIMAGAVLADILRFAYHNLNKDGATRPVYPSLALVERIVAQDLRLFAEKAEYGNVLSQSLRDLIERRPAFWGRGEGFDLQTELIGPPGSPRGISAVFDLADLDARTQAIVADWVMAQAFFPRLAHGLTYPTPNLFIVCDEADETISEKASKAYSQGYSIADQVVKQIRASGGCCIFSVSFYGKVSQMVAANCGVFACFNQDDPESLVEAARALHLPPEGYRFLSTIPTRSCVVRISQIPFSHGILTTVPDSPAPLPSSAATTAPLMWPQDSVAAPTTPPAQIAEQLEMLQKPLASRAMERKHGDMRRAKYTPTSGLMAKYPLLQHACLNLYAPVRVLWPLMGQTPPPATQLKLTAEIAGAGLAKFAELRVESRNQLLIEPTKEGFARCGLPVPKLIGLGELEHRCPVHWIRGAGLKRKYQISAIEYVWNGHALDAYHLTPRGHIGYEFCHLCFDNLTSHLRTCLLCAKPLDAMVIVTGTKADLAKARAKVEADSELESVRGRIQYSTILPYLEEVYPCAS